MLGHKYRVRPQNSPDIIWYILTTIGQNKMSIHKVLYPHDTRTYYFSDVDWNCNR